tara:strand:+ start:220 stop:390 length:171 start_codon:yes stop_codon:yes gene_type:complete
VLVGLLDSENRQISFSVDFKEIGIWSKAMKIRSIAIKEGFVFNLSLFLKVNLFREG